MASPGHLSRGLTSDVVLVGGGIIGLSLALELQRLGASVTVIERDAAWSGASSAAAGMLAAEDPHNPPPLLSFSRYSLSLYPGFLARIQALSGLPIPYQTDTTVQYTRNEAHTLAEHSIDPRQLGPALLAAARAASVHIVEHATVRAGKRRFGAFEIHTDSGQTLQAADIVHTAGAWAPPLAALALAPRKGQMLRVAMPSAAPLRDVHRAEHVYLVPRTTGPQAGTALIGATVEDAGFDLSTDPAALQQLRAHAAQLSPATAFAADAPLLEAWAGSRPYTADGLPLLGPLGAPDAHEWIASGHFRNGILLAPGTAVALSALIAGHPPAIDLSPFSPARFCPAS